MARPESTHYELAEAERRDIIKLIEQGKPLPERYRFLLFGDKREEELVWDAKTQQAPSFPSRPLKTPSACGKKVARASRPQPPLSLCLLAHP